MILSPVAMSYKYLGMQAAVNEISKKEKFCKKKYMAVLRWGIHKGECEDGQVSSYTQCVGEK